MFGAGLGLYGVKGSVYKKTSVDGRSGLGNIFLPVGRFHIGSKESETFFIFSDRSVVYIS